MQFLPKFLQFENLPAKFSVITQSGYIWGSVVKNLLKSYFRVPFFKKKMAQSF